MPGESPIALSAYRPYRDASPHAPLANEGGHVVMPESGASGQGHGLSERTGPFYAHAVHASTFRQRSLPLGASNSGA